jgi:hypothetical protein
LADLDGIVNPLIRQGGPHLLPKGVRIRRGPGDVKRPFDHNGRSQCGNEENGVHKKTALDKKIPDYI